VALPWHRGRACADLRAAFGVAAAPSAWRRAAKEGAGRLLSIRHEQAAHAMASGRGATLVGSWRGGDAVGVEASRQAGRGEREIGFPSVHGDTGQWWWWDL
jgi:hypothetical protein